MAIATSTFLQDIILFLRNYLRTNITDPLSRTSGVGFVMTSYPKRDVQYPIITIKNTGIDTTKLGMQSAQNWVNVKAEIRVWARNAKESDDLTQDIINALKNAQFGASGTGNEQIWGFKLQSCVPIVEVNEGENTIHSKVMTYNYNAIIS